MYIWGSVFVIAPTYFCFKTSVIVLIVTKKKVLDHCAHQNLGRELTYRRRWLLSACAYKNKQQGNIRLIKKHALNSECALNREGSDVKGGTKPCACSSHVHKVPRSQHEMEEYTMESVVRGHQVYKSIWHPLLGEQLRLEIEEGNGHDRYSWRSCYICLISTCA